MLDGNCDKQINKKKTKHGYILSKRFYMKEYKHEIFKFLFPRLVMNS